VLAALATALLVLAAWDAARAASLVARGARTTGVVVERKLSPDRKSAFPVVRFSAGGRSFTFQDRGGVRAVEIGAPATVLYDPADPGHARIDAFGSLWALSIALAAMGTVLAALAIRIFARLRRTSPPPSAPVSRDPSAPRR
jgi:hypothetical protein